MGDKLVGISVDEGWGKKEEKIRKDGEEPNADGVGGEREGGRWIRIRGRIACYLV